MKYNFETLHEHVGYLFYGLVVQEGRISASDLLKLTEFVDKTWKPGAAGDPTLSVYLGDCLLRGIRYASINTMPAAHALRSFKEYFIIHALGFSSPLRERILVSVQALQKEFGVSAVAAGIEKDLQRLFATPPVAA